MNISKATHQQTKAFNTRLVLKTIFDNEQISRADVSRITRLTRVTVSEIVAELLETGLVAEIGHGPSTGGKAPILLSVVDDARHLISLDLAAGVFRGAVVNLRGQVQHVIHMPSADRDGQQAVALVYELIDALLAASTHPILGIGIGAPGLIDSEQGIILQAINLDWRDLPLGKLLHEHYHLPVHIANDSQVAALAEFTFGSCQENTSLVAIKIGRGIGSGIIINGQLYQGEGFSAGEIGHVQTVEKGVLCRCGNYGCLETVASCASIARQAKSLALQQPESLLNQFVINSQEITFEHVAAAFRAGDELACQIGVDAAHYLGSAIAYLASALNIQHVILLGDITAFGNNWLELVHQEIRRRILASTAHRVKLSFGCLGTDVVILGASALLLTRELGLSLTRFQVAPALSRNNL